MLLPTPFTFRFLLGRRRLVGTLRRFIADRRASGEVRDDLLGRLLAATEDGRGMTERELVDECVTIFAAGHETTANGLTFALWLLARHPEVADRLAAEVAAVVGPDRAVALDDLGAMPYARRVVAEAMPALPAGVDRRPAGEGAGRRRRPAVPQGGGHLPQPVGRPPRPAVVARPRTVRPRPVRPRPVRRRRPPAVGLLPVRRRRPAVRRRELRLGRDDARDRVRRPGVAVGGGRRADVAGPGHHAPARAGGAGAGHAAGTVADEADTPAGADTRLPSVQAGLTSRREWQGRSSRPRQPALG